MKTIKIYFLLHSKAFLPSWKSFLEACKNDDRILTKIIYCPIRKQGLGHDGQFIDTEQWLKNNGIPYVHIKKINLLLDRPDLLVIQTPYDSFHRNNRYKTDRLKTFGFKLAYISYGLEFTEAYGNIKNHFRLPIHKNCWRIYTFSESIVEDYHKYCPIGNKHVRCFGHPKFDALFQSKDIKMPDWLKNKINGRRIICWHPHFPCNYSSKNGENVLSTFPWEENEAILNHIKNDQENFYIFMPHHMFLGVFEHDYKIPHETMESFKNDLECGNNSIIWYGEYPEILSWADIFLAERSAVTMEMITTGKPVIYLENYPEIYNQFGKDVLESYYYAKNAQDAIAYLKDILKGDDYKREKRTITFDKYIRPYWDGKCGERIKNDIIESKQELFKSNLQIAAEYFRAFFLIYLWRPIFLVTLEERQFVAHKVYRILGLKIKIRCKDVKKEIKND